MATYPVAMSNELSAYEQDNILRLLQRGWSVRRIARETGHRRETINRYGREAGILPPKPSGIGEVPTDSTAAKPSTPDNMPTDFPAVEVSSGGALRNDTIQDEVPRRRSTCEKHRAFITGERAKGRNATGRSIKTSSSIMDTVAPTTR